MRYLTIDQVLRIHARQISLFGGDPGIRDRGLLESAIAQPRGGFGGVSFHRTIEEKAAALAFSLVKNHAFVDGNKRTGAAALFLFLSRNGHDLNASDAAIESIIVGVANGTIDREQLRIWVREHMVRP
jgi:death-on-curing protein